MSSSTLTEAIREAMEDNLDNDRPTPHDPAIMRDRNDGRIYYGSALHREHGDEIVMDLAEGIGTWEPGSRDDLDIAAEGLAREIEQAA